MGNFFLVVQTCWDIELSRDSENLLWAMHILLAETSAANRMWEPQKADEPDEDSSGLQATNGHSGRNGQPSEGSLQITDSHPGGLTSAGAVRPPHSFMPQ